jgi:hypothetical protein
MIEFLANLRDFFRSEVHPNARPMNGLTSRVASALARPWQTSYVAPTLRTIDGVAYALKGYDVHWTPVTLDLGDDVARNPASLVYRIFKRAHGERYHSHGVECASLFPGWAHSAELSLRNAFWRAAFRVAPASFRLDDR